MGKYVFELSDGTPFVPDMALREWPELREIMERLSNSWVYSDLLFGYVGPRGAGLDAPSELRRISP